MSGGRGARSPLHESGERSGGGPGADGGDADAALLTALLDSMEVGLAAMDPSGALTHWNREAERLLGWTAAEAVGRPGLEGWAVRPADAAYVRQQLRGALAPGSRRLHEFAMLTRDGRRMLVRAQVGPLDAAAGPGLYFAFSEAGAQIDLERSLGLSEALLDHAPSGVVLVDADLRPAALGRSAADLLETGRDGALGAPLGELLAEGVEELESALQRVLATGRPLSGVRLWAVPRADPERRRRCWRSEFVRLGSPLGEEPVPLGVAWLFTDVTGEEQAEREGSVLRFRSTQLRRAGQAAAECEDPMEAAAGYLDYVLAGFADHALLDVLAAPGEPEGGEGAGGEEGAGGGRLLRAASAPSGAAAQGALPEPGGIPVRYGEQHPALLALERGGAIAISAEASAPGAGWAAGRRWPEGTAHGLCAPLRSRGRTVGVLTFLRGPGRQRFDRADIAFAEDVASRAAAAVDLALLSGRCLR
ncbi:PAS domain-containing protein [Phaeacidiphilus oryzae]|uniref:PAS domain-containing protein n=1 Tax=Phaeacidiphilus oryzae TaxID=348818 RepID=UPI000560652B|nr:PAS domain-containing protein [Phaeacidiphilus oryzae]